MTARNGKTPAISAQSDAAVTPVTVRHSRRHAKLCPHCGHPIVGSKAARSLFGKQRQMFQIIEQAGAQGIDSIRIMQLLYADDPNGGPVSVNIIAVMRTLINPKIAPFGLRIKGKSGRGGFYRLMTLGDAS